MSSLPIKALAVLACLSIPGAAQAVTYYRTTLLGINENPQVISPGSGTALLTLDGDMLTINIAFQDLIGDTVASHIHCCQAPPTNAGVATPVPTFPGFPLGVKSGVYSQTFNLSLASSYNPGFITLNGGTAASAETAFVNGLNAGRAYLNVHTVTFPAGEIRGQLALVPEPETWALMIVGFGLVGTALRRRKAFLPA